MQINLLNANEDEIKEFLYYSKDGVYLGRSEGLVPEQQLFDQAHYVFDSNSDIVKNLDILGALRKRLINLRKTLIAVPIKDMGKILDINKKIAELEHNIEDLEKNVSLSQAS